MSSTLKLTPSESLEIRSSTAEALEVEATYGPGAAYRDFFRLAGSDWLLRPLLTAIGAIGRARGYRASG